MLSARDIDEACESILQRVVGAEAMPPDLAAALVADLARRFPQAPALSPVLPLAMAASALEAMIEGVPARLAAAALWRDCALVAAEVLALQAEHPDEAPSLATLAARLGAEAAR